MTNDLWPPIGLIRSLLERGGAAAPVPAPMPERVRTGLGALSAPPRSSSRSPPRGDAHLLLPLSELARRREAVAQRAFAAHWAPGRLVSMRHDGLLWGVLLDRRLDGDLWQGWMAAGEADWAAAFDVLLEPDDEPFEPLFGLIQTWNVLSLVQSPRVCARVLGEISATRLAAIRAVHDEWASGRPTAIAPAPGRIALRTAGEAFTVLSGTPLASNADPRADYQALYRDAALRIGERLQAPAQPDAAPDAPWVLSRLRRWLTQDRWLRPAFALLALVVVVQNVGLLGRGDGANDDDAVRFRSAPTTVNVPDLAVRWQVGVSVVQSTQLLRQLSAEVVGGPDASGVWLLRLPDPALGRALLAASPLVAAVGPPVASAPP